MSVSTGHPVILGREPAYQTGDLVLRRSLLFGNRLGVGIQSDEAGRMPEQLLDDFDVRTARPQ